MRNISCTTQECTMTILFFHKYDVPLKSKPVSSVWPPARRGSLNFIGAARSPPQPRAPGLSGRCQASTASSRSQWHCQTATTSSRSQWPLPDLNRKLQICTRPQPRVPELSGHCRTSTPSSRSQWALPDLNRELQISVATA